MVKLTSLDGREISVNAELVETVEAKPDTTITLTTGNRILVREKVDEVIEKIMKYRREIASREKETSNQ